IGACVRLVHVCDWCMCAIGACVRLVHVCDWCMCAIGCTRIGYERRITALFQWPSDIDLEGALIFYHRDIIAK
ncbi:MAG TPA: hypothetical protein V6C97_27375, partial [Oculatellaceae cyanobacterium]